MAEAELGSPLGARWRAEAESAQEVALPTGSVVVSSPAPLGVGGLGRHMKEIVDALDRRSQPNVYLCEPTFERSTERRGLGARGLAATSTALTRFSPAWRMWQASREFDRDAARRLPPADHLIAFNGTALAQFRTGVARYESLSVVSATSHFRRVVLRQAEAHRQYPVERPWAQRLLRRNLMEYAQADRILVSSRYAWESFIEEGFAEDRLSLFPLTPDPRYRTGGAPPQSASFDVVYVGSLTVAKGIPLLLDAVRRLPYPDLRVELVGGWTTRGMRRFIERACARDARVKVCPGEPLSHLRTARLYVHPTYNDGFGYAPAEALACGVPVIVSEDTGMKDLIDPGHTGLVLPTGDLDALTEALDAAYRAEILGG
jgi:glycosyltransferase involved in cell wall biosynthesis